MEQTALTRRDFVCGAAALTQTTAQRKQIRLRGTIPAREFGKTGHKLPVLAMGGSALVVKWQDTYGVKLETAEKRAEMVRHAYDMGVRYFDTSRNYGESETVMGRGLKGVRENVFLATKVGVDWKKEAIIEPTQVRESLETSLKELQTDYVDCIQIHGPAFEYFGEKRAMEIYEELDRMRSEKMFRHIGLTGHTAFEPMYRLIDRKLFDQVFLAYGYFPKGMDTMLSQANLHWRELCITRARELGMGVLAMKVLGSFAFGHNAKNIVPDFGEERLRHLRAAAIRWALREDKPIFLVLGTSLPGDIDQNVATLGRDWKFTPEDRKVLADFTVRALGTKTIQGLKLT